MRDSRLFDSVVGSVSDTQDPWRLRELEDEARRPDPRIGQRLGNIRLDALAGEGGMGTVFEGWDEKLERKVAVKAVSRHYRSDAEARERFLREARLLSKIQHPNICQIHDHVEGPDGDYLVLELIRGRSLRQILEEDGRLEFGEALRVARQLVEALAAAHDRGVAHRDLKPGNIMITEDGTVKVLDFGLALSVERAVEKGSARAGLSWTESGSVQRPRAADFRGLEDEGADRDLQNRDLQNRDLQETVSVADGSGGSAIEGTLGYMSPEQARSEPAGAASDIYSLGLVLQEMFTGKRAYPPDLPLTYQLVKVGRGETLPAEGVDPDLAKLLERMKSVAPGSRPSAPDVAERLRWIAKKPARRARRVAVAAFILLLIGFAATMAFQRQRIAEEAERANREAEAARQVSDFLVDLFEVSDPWNTEASDITARELLDRGAVRIRGELEDQPLTRARLLGTIGEVYRRLGFYDDARPMLEEALELRRLEAAEDRELATGLAELAQLDSDTGDYDLALERFETAIELRRAALGPAHPDLVEAIHLKGYLHHRRGEYDQAIASYDEALAMQEELSGTRTTQAASLLSDLALSYDEMGESQMAEELHLRALEIREAILPADHPSVGVSYANLAAHYYHAGRYQRAVPLFQRDLEIATAALGPDHPEVAYSHNNLGGALRSLGRLTEAEPHLRRSLEIRREVLGDDHPSVAVAMHAMGSLSRDMGRVEAAEEFYEASFQIWREAYGMQHPHIAASLSSRGELYASVGRWAEARELLEDAVAIRVVHYGADHAFVADVKRHLADVLAEFGEATAAEETYREALAVARASHEDEPENQRTRLVLSNALLGLGEFLREDGRPEQAKQLFREARSLLEPVAASSESAPYDVALVKLLVELGEAETAEPVARRLLESGYARRDFVELCAAQGWTA